MVLAEGMDGLASTHCSHSQFNGVIHVTDLQLVGYFFVMIHLEELLPQLNISIRDGLNEPALDFKLNGDITTIAYLCLAGKVVYPVYKVINRFIRPLLDILQFIDTDSWGDLV